jgi:hypothetical protein
MKKKIITITLYFFMDTSKKDLPKKKPSAFDKVFLGIVIGGAVGSVVGATMSNKDIREKVRKKIADSSDSLQDIIKEHSQAPKKKSFWHKLHAFFIKKK